MSSLSIRSGELTDWERTTAQIAKERADTLAGSVEFSSLLLTQGAAVYFREQSRAPQQAEKHFKLLVKHLDDVLYGDKPKTLPEKIDGFAVKEIARFYKWKGSEVTGIHWVTMRTMMIEAKQCNYVVV